MLIQIKSNNVPKEKILNLSFAQSNKNNKNYLIVEVDSLNPQQSKIFVEVVDEAEFKNLLTEIAKQLQ